MKNQKFLFNRQLTIVLLPIFLGWFIFTNERAVAQSFVEDSETEFSIERIIGGIFTDLFRRFDLIVGQIDTFLEDKGIEIQKGALGIPDIAEAKIVFDENADLDKYGDMFGTQTGSTQGIKDKLLQQYLRELAQEYSENSGLSNEGQEKIAEKIEVAAASVETSETLARDSTNQDVSQNILRNISNQLSLQQQIDNAIVFEMQESKVSRGLELQMNSETLSEISKQTTRAERENLAGIRSSLSQNLLISLPGQHLTTDSN
ncbi:hypothetical protein [Myxosarcina sp. GI1]|uniref:hypothetical protein n=1 Tax=Myxosarcina sp. GI1 TaxID=1541065 RepID=UPI00056BCC3A|nr:hypothetical protein [Myxosarcina sp. GI1]